MGARFVSVDRETPMLLPPDLRDWAPEDDRVHFLIEAVDRLRLESVRINHRGTGDKQFPPHMMLALRIYSYGNGLFSSRKIERSTHRGLAISYLCAGTHPDPEKLFQGVNHLLRAVSALLYCFCCFRSLRTRKYSSSPESSCWGRCQQVIPFPDRAPWRFGSRRR
jgi:transposase